MGRNLETIPSEWSSFNRKVLRCDLRIIIKQQWKAFLIYVAIAIVCWWFNRNVTQPGKPGWFWKVLAFLFTHVVSMASAPAVETNASLLSGIPP